ncbi:MAG: asparagine synthase-related protein [Candidatus Marinimicrobia bacterium]|nr:asparagine synthase-related protein [Candidatus Neomarinimicrobiota bacterium]
MDFDNGFYRNIYHPDFYHYMQTEVNKVNLLFSKYFDTRADLSALDKVLYTEFHTKMVNDYLLVEDRMSMADSVEEGVPFLDIDLVNFAFFIPVHLKIRNNQTKYLFQKAMAGKLPQDIVAKKKWGFSVNPYLQFKKDLKAVAEKILTREFVELQGIFNYDYLRLIMDYQPHPRLRWHYNYLWIVVKIVIWEKMFVKTNEFKSPSFEIGVYYQ